MFSTFGTLFRVSTFGESHGRGVGVVIDGCPARLPLTEADIQPQLDRRRPGQSRLATEREEGDQVTILSGTQNGLTLGTPIGLIAEIFESFAIGFILNGHLAEAIQVTDAWEAKLPRDARPCYLRGVMHRDVGWPAQAEAEFRKTLDREPQFAEASLELAILLMRSQRYEEAVEHYGRALAKPGHEAKVFVGLAHCYRMLGDVDAAREVLQPLVRSSSPNVGALAEMGSIELMAGNYEQALRWIEQARTSIPRNSELSYAYGSTLAALKRHDSNEVPLVNLQYRGEELWICPEHLAHPDPHAWAIGR